MTHPVELSVELVPIWHRDPPQINIGIDSIQTVLLDQPRKFDFNFAGQGQHRLIIELLNKQANDTDLDRGLDKAVIVKSIAFFGISDQRFVWAGKYKPAYPEPWFSQQASPPPEILVNQDRLSWNGCWSLEFDVPVFTWIHQQLNLGWIYD